MVIAALLVASKAIDDTFHANLFMAQLGGIGVYELNKLETDLCTQLQWRLLPTAGDLGELNDALANPKATFWNAWYNAPRAVGAGGEGGAAAVVPCAGHEGPICASS